MNECPCGFQLSDLLRRGADFHRDHKAHHLAQFPAQRFDRGAVDNLDVLIRIAEQAEGECA